MVTRFILTLLVGVLGGIIGIKLKIPAGALFGAMVFTAAYNLATNFGYVPEQVNTILQVLIGTTIGLSFNMQTIRDMGSIMLAAVIMVIGLLVFSLLLGWLISRLTGLDLITSLLSTSPGGLSNMVLISDVFGAKAHIVALLHTLRLISVIVFMPIVVKIVSYFSKGY